LNATWTWSGIVNGQWSGTLDGWSSGVRNGNSVLLVNDNLGENYLSVYFSRDEHYLNTKDVWAGIDDADLLVGFDNWVEARGVTSIYNNEISEALSQNIVTASDLNANFSNRINAAGQSIYQGWSGALNGWDVTQDSGNLKFTSKTEKTNVNNLSVTTLDLNNQVISATQSSYVQGSPDVSTPGITETATVTFSTLAAGQTVSVAGRTFTAGSGGASASDVAAAMAQTASLTSGTSVADPTVGTFSGAITGWTTGGQSGAAGGVGGSGSTIWSGNILNALGLATATAGTAGGTGVIASAAANITPTTIVCGGPSGGNTTTAVSC
jgi:hypothetical protein